MIRFILLLAVFVLPIAAFSQANGDFRSHQNGNWNDPNSWEQYIGTTWVYPAPMTPSSPLTTPASNIIDVLNTHTIIVTATVSAYSVIIESQATVEIAQGVTFNVSNNGSSSASFPEFSILGTLQIDSLATFAVNAGIVPNKVYVNIGNGSGGTITTKGNLTFGSNSRLVFAANSTYDLRHTNDAGSIPYLSTSPAAVVWNAASTCQITGYVNNTTVPSGLASTFGNFIWNTPNFAIGDVFDLGGQITTVNGLFAVLATGNAYLYLSNTGGYTMNVAGAFLTDGSSTNLLLAGDGGGTATINVAGETSIIGGEIYGVAGTTNVTFNAAQQFFIQGGDVDFNGGGGVFTLNASADVEMGGNSVQSSSGTATVNFVGTTQNFLADVVETGTINYHIASGSTLTLSGNLTGSGTLLVDNGATVLLTSTDTQGAITSGSSYGNVLLAGSRTFTSGSTIVYSNGTVAIGSGQPSTTGVNTIVDGGTGTTLLLASNATFGGSLTLLSSSIALGSNTITMNGTLVPNSNSLVATTGSSVAIGGSGAFGTLSMTGSNVINNFTLNRISSGSVTLGNSLGINGTFTQTAGDITLSGDTLTISGPFVRSAGSIIGNSSAISTDAIVINGSGAFDAAAKGLGIGAGTYLKLLSINRTGATVTVGSAFNLLDLSLLAGNFVTNGTITMASGGAVIARDAGTVTGTPFSAVSKYNVTYLNTTGSPQATGIEMPDASTGYLGKLTIKSSDQITLSKAIQVNDSLKFTSGVFNPNSNAIEIKGSVAAATSENLTSSAITFSGTSTISGSGVLTFGAITITSVGTVTPTSNMFINGNLVNNGNLNNGLSGTTTFGGTTTISGSSVSSFYNVTIASSSSLTGPANFNVGGNWVNNGTFNDGYATNSVTFTGTGTISGSAVSPVSDFSSIVISSTGNITPPASLGLNGNFTNNGTFNAGSGTVLFDGSTNQTISGSTVTLFNNITSSNPSSIRFTSPQSISGALTISATNGIVNANGNLTLLSTSSGDAYIAALTNGASVTGNLTVQRYLPIDQSGDDPSVNGKVYRYLAPQVTGAFVSDWKADFPVTGTFNDPSQQSDFPSLGAFNTSGPSLYIYNEAHTPTSTQNDRYESYPPNGQTSTSTPLTNGTGYAAYMRDPNPIVPNLTGVAGQGAVPIIVTNQSGSVAGNDGYNLIGNPYPAPISWDNVTLPGGVSGQIAFKDNTDNIGVGSGAYVYYNHGGVGIPASYTGIIASGQAFFVRATTTSTITFQETNKVSVGNPQFIRIGAPSNIARVHVSGNGFTDELAVYFSPNGIDAADASDAYKLVNDHINLYSLTSDAQKAAINSMAQLDCFKSVSLGLDNVTPGAYTLDFAQLDSFDPTLTIKIVDAWTNTTKIISPTAATYAFSVTTDANSFGTKRFSLTFTSVPLPTSLALQKSDVCSGSDASVSIGSSMIGISYYLTLGGNQIGSALNGNGDVLSFAIPTASMSTGVNRFTITATSSSCASAFYAQKDSITVQGIYSVSKASSSTSCNAGPVTLTAQGAPVSGYYNWYDTDGASVAIAGQSSATFVTPTLLKSKTYYVAAVNSLGCEGTRVPVKANVTNFDPALITQLSESILQSNFAIGNHWLLNGVALADTTMTLTIKESGVYTLNVTIGSCLTSDERTLVVTGIGEPMAELSGYPNPVAGVFNVVIPDKDNAIASQLPVFNSLGSQMGVINLTSDGTVKKGQFNFEPFASGFYFIRVNSGSSSRVLKVIKN